MNNPYKSMHVLTEEEYKDFKRYKTSLPPNLAKCPIDGREFVNENVLDGFQCNICGKVFKYKRSLTKHLKTHAPQAEVSKRSVLDDQMPNQPAAVVVTPVPTSALMVVQNKHNNHKQQQQRSILNFTAKQWLTL